MSTQSAITARGATTGRFLVRRDRPGDEAQIVAAAELALRRAVEPGSVGRAFDRWLWQCWNPPAGRRTFLIVDADGTIAAQCSLVPQAADTPWGARCFARVGAVLVHPAYEGILRCEEVTESLGRALGVDAAAGGVVLHYGTATAGDGDDASGLRALLPVRFGAIDYLVRPAVGSPPRGAGGVMVERLVALPDEVTELWERCLPADPCTVRRDHPYLSWRYERVPTRRDYELHAARRAGVLTGVLVLRPFHEQVPGACAIADWICDPGDDDSAAALLELACRRAQECERRFVVAAFAAPSLERRRLEAAGFVTVPAARWATRELLVGAGDRHLTAACLRDRWCYALGDTGLV